MGARTILAVSEPKHRPRVVVRGVGVVWGFVLALPLAAALIVFVAQNTNDVVVHWTVWKVRSPLAAVVLVTIFAAVVLAEIVGVVWRHRRRRILARAEPTLTDLVHPAAATEPEPPVAPSEEPPPATPHTLDGEDEPAPPG